MRRGCRGAAEVRDFFGQVEDVAVFGNPFLLRVHVPGFEDFE